jgi:hypothetical protein
VLQNDDQHRPRRVLGRAPVHNVKQAINDGLSVLWLSANDVYMVTPFTPNAKGDANRRLTRETCFGEFREEEKEAYSKVLGPFENPGPTSATSSARAPSFPSTAAVTGPARSRITGSSKAPA